MNNISTLATALLCTLVLGIANASDLEVVDLHGKPSNLNVMIKDQHWNIVMAWATYCPACKKDFLKLNEFIKSHTQDSVHVIGVSVDGADKINVVEKTVREYELKFDNAISEFNDFTGLYLFETDQYFAGTPTYMVYSPEGALVAHGAGRMDFERLSQFLKTRQPVNSSP